MMGELRKRSERTTMLARIGGALAEPHRDEVFAASLGFAPQKYFPRHRVIVASANTVDELAIPGQAIADSAESGASRS
jgi:hypothetical protein